MKKFLLATTALALSASVAAAEVKVTGDGRMGVVYDGENANFNSRIRAIFTLSGETDGGLAFGGSFRADNAGASATGQNGVIFMSGAFGKLSLGDVDGGAETAVGDVSGIGYTSPSQFMAWRETEYLTASGQASDPDLLYTYTTGGLTFALSMSDGTQDGNFGTGTSEEYSVGVKYVFGDYTVGIGYESRKWDMLSANTGSPAGSRDREDQWIIGGSAKFGDAVVKAFYAQGSAYESAATTNTGWDGGKPILGTTLQDFDQYGVSLDYTFGATTVTGFYRELSMDVTGDATYYGIGAAYNLGGGATLKGGIMNVERDAGAAIGPYGASAFDDTVADFGIIFTF